MGLTDLNHWKSLINIGFTKILVLKVLSGGPNHGYGILKELQSMTSGCCTPTLGTIYPILKELTKQGYAVVGEDQQLKGRAEAAGLHPDTSGDRGLPRGA